MRNKIILTLFTVLVLAFLVNMQLKLSEEEKAASSSPSTVNAQKESVGNQPLPVAGTQFSLPAGFAVQTYANKLGKPRVMEFDPEGNMLVSITSNGRIVVLPDKNKDGKSDKTVRLLSGLNNPHGIALKCSATSTCDLYVAETNRLSVYKYDPKTLKATGRRNLLSLPGGGGHVTRSLLLTKQNNRDVLLISIGSSCNVCNESNSWRAAVVSYDIGSKKAELFAKGLRNSVFMTTDKSGKIWATEMGRDLLGDNIPPEEINILERGKNYGWPVCYGKNIHDDNFDKNTYIRNPCEEPLETPSYIDMQAHSAPLGLAFTPESWGSEFSGDLLVAFHGSWNRTVPTGYKIVRLKLDGEGRYESTEDFMTGFMKSNGQKIGRPADVKIISGAMYVTDDLNGNIYRITKKS